MATIEEDPQEEFSDSEDSDDDGEGEVNLVYDPMLELSPQLTRTPSLPGGSYDQRIIDSGNRRT